MATVNKLVTCLWFDGKAEQAARYYVSVFKNARMGKVSYYPSEGIEQHGQPAGRVMVAEFEIEGQQFIGLNGGAQFKFSEAISFQVMCDDQAEVDYFWSTLTQDGGEEGPCGWLKDKFGLSWQIVPKRLMAMMGDSDTKKTGRVMKAFMQMKRFDLAALERAYAE